MLLCVIYLSFYWPLYGHFRVIFFGGEGALSELVENCNAIEFCSGCLLLCLRCESIFTTKVALFFYHLLCCCSVCIKCGWQLTGTSTNIRVWNINCSFYCSVGPLGGFCNTCWTLSENATDLLSLLSGTCEPNIIVLQAARNLQDCLRQPNIGRFYERRCAIVQPFKPSFVLCSYRSHPDCMVFYAPALKGFGKWPEQLAKAWVNEIICAYLLGTWESLQILVL